MMTSENDVKMICTVGIIFIKVNDEKLFNLRNKASLKG